MKPNEKALLDGLDTLYENVKALRNKERRRIQSACQSRRRPRKKAQRVEKPKED